jgi:acid phosphatase
MHLGDQLEAAGIAWRAYAEGAGAPCATADNDTAHYAVKHVPFLYYDNVRTNASRCTQRVRDYSDLAADLTAGTYRFSYITPNLCHDMHDSCGGDSVANGDAWLMANVPRILARPGFAAGGTDVLFIVWDEEETLSRGDPIPFIAISPLVRAGGTASATFNHYSFLATVQDGLGLPRIANSRSAMPITGFWR